MINEQEENELLDVTQKVIQNKNQYTREESLINMDVILTLLCLHEDEKVGSLSSLKEEFAAAISLAATFGYEQRLYLAAKYPESRDINKEKKFLLTASELSEKDFNRLVKRMQRKLEATVKKIIWLNRKSRDLIGEGFIRGYINTRDANQCRDLLSDLMDAYQIEKYPLCEDFFPEDI